MITYNFKLFDSEDVLANSRGEVTSPTFIRNNKLSPEGLFSEQIFGAKHDYRCQCGKFSDKLFEGIVCENCKVEVTKSSVRNTRSAHIKLAMPVMTKIAYDYLKKFVNLPKYQDMLTHPLNYLHVYIKRDNSGFPVVFNGELMYVRFEFASDIDDTQTNRFYLGTNIMGILEGLKMIDHQRYLTTLQRRKKNESFTILTKVVNDGKQLSSFIMTHLYVLPAGLRDYNVTTGTMHVINTLYISILRQNLRLAKVLEINQGLSVFNRVMSLDHAILTKEINFLLQGGGEYHGTEIPGISESMYGKTGLIRGEMLGRRLDYTARSVIVSAPELKLNEVLLPYDLVKKVMRPVIYRHIARSPVLLEKYKGFKGFKGKKALAFLYKYSSEVVDDIMFNKLDGNIPVILNRQPTLHLLGLLGFDVRINRNKSAKFIGLNPLVTGGFNADFDGDTTQLIFPQTDLAVKEVKEKVYATKNTFSPAHYGGILTFGQDITMGLYSSTCSELNDGCKPEELPGFVELNCLFEKYGIDYRLTADMLPLNKSRVSKMVFDIQCLDYPDETLHEIFHEIKLLGFKYITLYGISLTLNDLDPYMPDKYDMTAIEFNKYVKESLENLKSKDSNFNFLVDSKARGSVNQVQQILIGKGQLLDIDGTVLPPITTSLSRGLNEAEFVQSIVGSRKGLINKVLSVGESGYFTAKLVKSTRDIRISSLDDCGTKSYQKFSVDNSLIGRITSSGELITPTYVSKNKGKIVKVRSPLYCKAEDGICKTCYGRILHKNLSVPESGQNVGVISGQSLGEPATQLLLRVFHTSGSTSMSIDELKAEYNQDVKITQESGIVSIEINDLIYLRNSKEVTLHLPLGTTKVKKGELVANIARSEGDISTKFPEIESIFSGVVPAKLDEAVLAPATGILRLKRLKCTTQEMPEKDSIVTWPKTVISAECYIEGDECDSESFDVNLLSTPFLFPIGSRVEIGQQITGGVIPFQKLYNLVPREDFIKSFIEKISGIYKSEGINIASIHYEIILTSMLSKVEIVESDNPEYPVGTIVEKDMKFDASDGIVTKEVLSSLMKVGLSKSFLQHLSLGYMGKAMDKLLSTYNDLGRYSADKLCLELPY